MTQVTIYEAKTHFSQLIRRVQAGEEITIARGKEPVVQMIPVPKEKKDRVFGRAKGFVKWISPDFDGPLEEFEEFMR